MKLKHLSGGGDALKPHSVSSLKNGAWWEGNTFSLGELDQLRGVYP